MSRIGIFKKSPSQRGAFFFVLGWAALFSVGAWTQVHETRESTEVEIAGVVSVIQPNYIVVVYNNALDGVEQEIGFSRTPDIKLKYRSHWEKIEKDEPVIFRFTETRRVREGRDVEGAIRRESYVIERSLKQLEFGKYENQALVSG